MPKHSPPHGETTRRGFLKQAGLGATALALPAVPTPSRASGSALRIGIIGCGVRGAKTLMPGLQAMSDVRIGAVCDVYRKNLKTARSAAGGSSVMATDDYREILDSEKLDAVVIATPDRHHVPMTIEAIAAGKDVYVEKPLTYSLAEAARIRDAVEASDRIVQVGTQQRSMPQFAHAKRLFEDGTLGPVRQVRMWWNRNATPVKVPEYDVRAADVDWPAFLGDAPDRPFDPFTMMRWRFFWDLGGGSLTDLMIHWLDAASWMLGLGIPDKIATIGDHFAMAGLYEIPDTVQCLMHYGREGVQASFCSCFVNSHESAGLELRSEKATIYLDRSRLELHPESKHGLKPTEMILDPSMPRGRGADGKVRDGKTGTELHLENWIDCVRSRKQAIATVPSVLASTNATHWANRALREERMVTPKEEEILK